MKLLGIDHGERRIGLAVSDETDTLALPLEQIDAQPMERACEHIVELARERGIERIVVGLPRNMDGTYGPAAQTVREFIVELRKLVAAEIVEWDERLSTAQAERTMLEADYSRKRRRAQRDALAAQLILQNYMDSESARRRRREEADSQ
ncbi:MAG: Holliday junction resolvase RuvX [Verrucomicrobia bacterium]|nr:Holliday junction resolvase RuvX [Verrucomicrobiota bacterium]